MRRHARTIVAISALLSLTLVLGTSLATATAPVVSIDAPSSVSYTSVHVAGKVNPEDQETSYYFQYSADPVNEGWSYGAFQGPLAANSGEAAVADDLTGLKPGTEYFVRLVAESADGQSISAEPYPSFTTLAVPAPAVTIAAPSAIGAEGAHFSGTINHEAPAGNPPAFDVSWSFQCTPECLGLSGTIPADASSHTVEADATGLEPNTAYEVTLVATNAGGSASAGPETFTTSLALPVVTTKPAFAIAGGSEAVLGGAVNPRNSPTTFWVEYGPDENYGLSAPLSEDASAGSGGTPVAVSQRVTGLTPETTYHFRLRAANAKGQVAGGDMTFTTALAGVGPPACANEAIRVQQSSQFLSECRAWEMVSPVNKGSNDIPFTMTRTQSSTSGDGVAYISSGAFAGAEGTGVVVNYLARRSGNGWTTTALTPPQQTSEATFLTFGSYRAFSADLSRGAVRTPPPSPVPGAPAGLVNLLVRDTTSKAYRLVSEVGPSAASPFYQPWYAAASADFSHVLFESNGALTADAPDDGLMKAYEWIDGAGLRLAGVMADGTAAPGGSSAGRGASRFGAQLSQRRTAETISADGSRIFFTAEPDFDGAGQIYARVNGSTTIHVSKSQNDTPEAEPKPATFRGATPSGSRVYFTSAEQLTNDDQDSATDLYAFDVESEELVRLSKDSEPADGGGAEALGMLGQSDDGSYVYFAAARQLVPGAPISPAVKLYVWHAGDLRYVGSAGGVFETAMWSGEYEYADQYNTARVTPNGRFLLFTSDQPMGSYDNAGLRQAYLYDFEADAAPTCISCRPDGKPATKHVFPETFSPGAPSQQVDYRPRLLLPDGSRAFFNTAEPLVARDANGRVDAYAYDVASGRVSLLSSGQSSDDSFFVDASADGHDAFITTREQAVAADTDNNTDLYDLRIGGGWPELQPPSKPCEGDACQGEPQPEPGLSLQSSMGFSGPGDVRQRKTRSRRCKKPKQGAKAPRCRSSKAKAKRDGAKRRTGSANKGGRR